MEIKYVVLISLLIGVLSSPYLVYGVDRNRLDYKVEVYLLDVNNIFDKYGDLYILRNEYIYPENFVSVSGQIWISIKGLNDWDPNGHPYLEGFTLDSDIGNYSDNYFWKRIRWDIYTYVKDLGYRDIYVGIAGNLIEISIGGGADPNDLLNNVDAIGDIYMNWIGKALKALEREGFYLPIDKFLDGINNRIRIVILETPFKRYTDNFSLDLEHISITDPSNIYPKYGFIIQAMGPETYFGVYSIEIPVACVDPTFNVEYNLSSITDILGSIREIKNALFGYEKEVIIIPTKKCYNGNPFTGPGSEDIENRAKDIELYKPILVKVINYGYVVDTPVETKDSTKDLMDQKPKADIDMSQIKWGLELFLASIIGITGLIIILIYIFKSKG